MRAEACKLRALGAAQSSLDLMKALLKPIGLNRLSVVQNVRHKASELLLRFRRSGDLLLIEADGHPMYVFNDPYHVELYLGRPYEPYTVRLFKKAVKPGGVVVDIGANVGYFSLVAGHRVGPQGKVYAFEPGPENYEVLRRNIEINKLPNVAPVAKAVSDVSRAGVLTLGELSTHHSLFSPAIVNPKGTVPVECVALDDFLNGATPDVVKMDIEGNEIRALDGMQRIIRKSKSLAMIVELNPVCLREASAEPRELILKLRELGLELCAIDDDKTELNPVTDAYITQINDRPLGWFVNLYCTKGLPNPCSS